MKNNKKPGKSQEKNEVKIEFSGKNLTYFGGMKLFGRFVKKLGVEKALDREVVLERRESRYSVGRIFLSLIYGMVLDLHRLSDTIVLRVDKVFLKIVRFSEYPHQTTFTRFLEKFTVPIARKIGEVNVGLLLKVRGDFKETKKEITFDLDSHVKTVYGHQQRAQVGYNPKKPGRKSYHPIFCFIGETRDFLWGRFRSGKSYSAKGSIRFLRECLSLLKWVGEFFVRGDSAFYDDKFLRYVEEKGGKYAIAVKLYRSIQARLGGVKYVSIGGGKEAGEFWYQAEDWRKQRRMVVIREKIVEENKEKKQLKLFELAGYNYQVIVTNIEDKTAEEVWQFYNGRACVENMIKEGIIGYGLDVCVSHWYGANVAHFFTTMLSYNIMNWFKESILEQKEKKRMVKWIRRRLLFIAGRLVRSGRKWILKLSEDYPWQREYWRAEEKLKLLQFDG